jgi:hypothetical protein
MALNDLRARFDAVPTTAGSPAHEVKVALMNAAVKINDVVRGDDMLLTDITQHLEKALHRAVSRLPVGEETGNDEERRSESQAGGEDKPAGKAKATTTAR